MATIWKIIDALGNILTKEDEGYEDAFHDGYARAEAEEGEYNYLSEDNTLLNSDIYDSVTDFVGGLATAVKDGLTYIVNTLGETITSTGFLKVGDFIGDMARVQQEDGTFNYVTRDGTLLFETGFRQLTAFVGGVAKALKDDGLWYAYNEDGTLVSETGHTYIGDFTEDFAVYRDDTETQAEDGTAATTSQYGYLGKDGTTLTGDWTDATDITDGKGIVTTGEGKRRYVKTDGTELGGTDYDLALPFQDGWGRAKRDGLWYLVAEDGGESETGYKAVGVPCWGMTLVTNADGTKNFVDGDGGTLMETSLQDARPFANGYAAIEEDDLWNFIGTDGVTTSTSWFERLTDYNGKCAEALLEGAWYRINIKGELLKRLRDAETETETATEETTTQDGDD